MNPWDALWVTNDTNIQNGYGYPWKITDKWKDEPDRPEPYSSTNRIDPNAVCKGNTLKVGEELRQNEYLMSPDRRYIALMQGDGHLVIYSTNATLWMSSFYYADKNDKGSKLVMQASDGNAVIYNDSGKALWASGTGDKNATHIAMQNDGNLVVYTSNGKALWASDTSNVDIVGNSLPFFATEKHNIGDDFYAHVVNNNSHVLTNASNNSTRWQIENPRDTSQIMRFQRHSDGSYRITSLSTGRALDVKGVGRDEFKTELYFHNVHDEHNQRFWVEQNGNRIMLSPKNSPYYVIDGAGGQAGFSSGSELWTFVRNNTAPQWFTLKIINNIDEYLNPPPDNLYISNIDLDNTYIELHNPTETPISAKGLYLSNDNGDYFMWQMPLVIVRPNQRVLNEANPDPRVGVSRL